MAGNGYMALPGLRDDAVLSPGSPAPPAALAPPPPTEQQADLWHRLTAWPAAHVRLPWRRPAHEPQPPASGYLTLIPLSDSRLQPRDSRITAVFLLGFALVVAAAVFVAVPRGVSVGDINVHTTRMSWNTTKSTYQLKLEARIPVTNPSYLPRASTIAGDLRVLFYKTQAGGAHIKTVQLPPRATTVLHVAVDASDVPPDYILSILSQCSTFPETLIFFLRGRLEARYLWMRQHVGEISTYFMVSCS